MMTLIGGELLAGGAALVTIGTGAVGLRAWLTKRRREESERAPIYGSAVWGRSSTPLRTEIIPLRFEIALNRQIPEIEIEVRCVNYMSAKLRIDQLIVDWFSLENQVQLEKIPCESDQEIDYRRSEVVICRRKLIDSEIRALQVINPPAARAELRIRLRGRARWSKVEWRSHGIGSIPGRLT